MQINEVPEVFIEEMLLDSKQKKIFAGLKRIGEEISNFYIDGVRLIKNYDELNSRAYLIGHIAREIEGSIRTNLLENKKLKKSLKTYTKDIVRINKNKDITNIIKPNSDLKLKDAHLRSIMSSLNENELSNLSKKWLIVTYKFHEFAHRHGPSKKSRDPEEIINLWYEFEDLIYEFVGENILFLKMLDLIIDSEIKKDSAETLLNIFKEKHFEKYVIENLIKKKICLKWLPSLHENDYFNPKNNPGKKYINKDKESFSYPKWIALIYLLNATRENNEKNDEKTWKLIKEIIAPIIEKRRDENDDQINVYSDYDLFRIINSMDINILDQEHIDFISFIVKSNNDSGMTADEISKKLFPKLIKNGKKEFALTILSAIFDYKADGYREKVSSKMESYWFVEFINTNKDLIKISILKESIEIILKTIEEIVKNDRSQFNNIRISSIGDEFMLSSDKFNYQVVATHLIGELLLSLEIEPLKEKCKYLLSEELKEFPIFTRIAFHIIMEKYHELKDFFWNRTDNPLELSLWRHEVYELFKKNAEHFSSTKVEKILNWIKNKNYRFGDNITDENVKKATAYAKREWLSALKDIEKKHPTIESMRKENEKISDSEIKHAGYSFWMETDNDAEWGDPSLEINENTVINLTNLSIDDLKKELSDNSEDDVFLNSFQVSFSRNIESSVDLLEHLIDIDFKYISRLMNIFSSKFREGNIFDLKKGFNWISKVLDSISSKKQVSYEEENFIYSVCEWIESGTKGDEKKFDDDILPEIKTVALKLFDIPFFDECIKYDRFNIWNSREAKKWFALHSFIARWVRIKNTDIANGERWRGLEKLKKVIEDILDEKQTISLHFRFVFSMYLPVYIYIDKEFVTNNLENIFPEDIDKWKASFLGYVSARSFYIKNYEMLKEEYIRGIDYLKTGEVDSYFFNKVNHHICDTYLQKTMKKENTEDELIFKYIKTADSKFISLIVGHFLKIKIPNLISPLWKAIHCRMESDIDLREIVLPQIFQWISLIKIDEEFQNIILEELSWLPEPFTLTIFVLEDIKKTAKENPSFSIKALKIIVSKIEYNQTFLLDRYAEEILNKVYDNGTDEDRILFDEVCNSLLERGYTKAKAIYDNNRNA